MKKLLMSGAVLSAFALSVGVVSSASASENTSTTTERRRAEVVDYSSETARKEAAQKQEKEQKDRRATAKTDLSIRTETRKVYANKTDNSAEKEAKAQREKEQKDRRENATTTIAIEHKKREYVNTDIVKTDDEGVHDLKVYDFKGKVLEIDGKVVTVKSDLAGRQEIDFKTNKGLYRMTVRVSFGRANLVKAPYLVTTGINANTTSKTEGWIQKTNGRWQFLRNGKPVEHDWVKDNGKWYYLDKFGDMHSGGWYHLKGSWYYFNHSGEMNEGWLYYNKKWYYNIPGSGAMAYEWVQDGEKWYYLQGDGTMKASTWFEVGRKWYYVYDNGELAVDTWVGGYRVDASGAWVHPRIDPTTYYGN